MRRTVGIGAAAAMAVFVAAAAIRSASDVAAAPARTAAADATARIVDSAQALLATLDQAGKTKVQFPYEGPQKARWSNLPVGIFEREGLRLGDLTQTQRTAAMALLSAAFSQGGYRKVVEIMRGDEVLRGAAGDPPRGGGPGRGGPAGRGGPGGGVRFGEDEYFLAFLGVPSKSAPWMLQFGGHHLGST